MAYTTINKSTDYFTPHIWSGTNSNHTESIGMQPDLVWVKGRNNSTDHTLFDAVRGPFGNGNSLSSNTTAAEGGSNTTAYGGISGVTSDGFTVTAGSSNADYVNTSGRTYASWNWKANGAGSANTDGSISSTVSVNTTSGFSIVKYTGTGSTATVGHGLGAVPDMMIIKKYSGAGTQWTIYHKSLGNTKHILFTTGSETTQANYWNDTSPTSSVWTMGNQSEINGSGATNICYAFAEKQGFSKFGSYIGNGSTDGTFVYTGFKPAYVTLKRSSNNSDWHHFDNKRAGFNGDNDYLKLNGSDSEGTSGDRIDFLSNGFKLRYATGNLNETGDTFIYNAFAEAPLVGTNGVTAKAR